MQEMSAKVPPWISRPRNRFRRASLTEEEEEKKVKKETSSISGGSLKSKEEMHETKKNKEKQGEQEKKEEVLIELNAQKPAKKQETEEQEKRVKHETSSVIADYRKSEKEAKTKKDTEDKGKQEKKEQVLIELMDLPLSNLSTHDKPLRFFVIGDWGDPTQTLKKVAKAMASRAMKDPISFVLAVGDNFYPMGVKSANDRQFREKWIKVFLKYNSLRVPWHVCLGNHDYEGNPKAQIEFTSSANNPGGYWHCPSENYDFSCPLPGGGCADFFALDTNACSTSLEWKYPNALPLLQAHVDTVLRSKLSASQATWKLVFGHHPMYNQGSRHWTQGHLLREECHLEESLVANGVHAYFCGHEHVFQHHFCHGVDHFCCGASGASYSNFYGGRCGDKTSPGWADEALHAGFAEVCLTSTSMTVSFISADESVIHTVHRDLPSKCEGLKDSIGGHASGEEHVSRSDNVANRR
mmetsp:Transcript_3150/g.5652  ORF Transcript_3150/g.5652 Transcript_3150/m.5652 type:complete len:467 (-) Transcript_3150:378-1778(-)